MIDGMPIRYARVGDIPDMRTIERASQFQGLRLDSLVSRFTTSGADLTQPRCSR